MKKSHIVFRILVVLMMIIAFMACASTVEAGGHWGIF